MMDLLISVKSKHAWSKLKTSGEIPTDQITDTFIVIVPQSVNVKELRTVMILMTYSPNYL